MIKAETGAVLFACTGVEPRQGQTLVVVGSSAELGGGDASRGVTLHQLKNPAFSSVWMSFPICHSACSNVRFQFALVGPGLDSVESGASASGGVPLIAGASLVEGVQNSSAVTSSALPSAVPTDDRSHDCHGYVTLCEPLGCGLREMEVVDGGLVLFGGRWGEGGTQVTPLTWNDMVTAQQQLEQDASPSVSAKSDSERERVREREGTGDRENFGGLPERGMRGSSFTVGDGVVVSAAPLTFAFSEREGERERKNGEGRAVQSEAEFSSNRRSTLSVQQGGCGERVTLSELGVVGGGGVVPITAKEGILMASVDSAQRGGASVSGGRPETSEYVSTQARGDEVMEERRRYGNSDQAVRFAPAAVKKRGWVGGKGGDLSGGKTAESVNGLAGCDGSVLIVRDGHAVSREGESVCPSAAACEGSKRRRLSSLSVAVSVSGSERRGGEEPLVTERSSVRPFPSVLPQHSHCQKSLLSFASDTHPFRMPNGDVACERETVCGLHGEGETRKWFTEGESLRAGERGTATEASKSPLCLYDRCHTECGGGGKKHPVTSIVRDDSTRGVGVGREGKTRECTGEVKRDRYGNILCPHGRVRCCCKECGGKSICEHGRQRSRCKDCGAKSFCEHGRQRSQCKECGGKGICEHGRKRSECKDCGGKSICEHGRLRNRCKECGGKSVCEHGRRRCQCKECGGKSICEHGRQRYYCKDCGGNGICVHRKQRRHCQECKLLSVLQH